MAGSNYKPSLALVLAHEGGFVDHPNDPGGPTNQGITQRVYDAFRKYHGQKMQSVKFILSSEVSEIYNKNYWKLCRADSLPYGLDYAVFDFAVNSGVSRAVRYLQRTIGVQDDGIIGLITLSTIEEKYKFNEELIIAQYCAHRVAFLKSLKTFPIFGKGWMRRVVGNRAGVQEGDKGVIDYATMMARYDQAVVTPKPIGVNEGEISGKAITSLEPETFAEATIITTPSEVKSLAAISVNNNFLANEIGR